MTVGLYYGTERILANDTDNLLVKAFISVIEGKDKQVTLDPSRASYDHYYGHVDASFWRTLNNFTSAEGRGHLFIFFKEYFEFFPLAPGESRFDHRKIESEGSETHIAYALKGGYGVSVSARFDSKRGLKTITAGGAPPDSNEAKIFAGLTPPRDVFSALPHLERLLDVYCFPEKYFP
ncbi:MAG: hypothetical protein V2A62_00930 [Candidatus Woesearchaeota archaeon]